MTKLISKILLGILASSLGIVLILGLLEARQISLLTINAYRGVQKINQAVMHTRTGNLSIARSEALAANGYLSSSLASSENISHSVLSYLPVVDSQLQEIEHLIAALELLSRSLSQGLDFAGEIHQITQGSKAANYNDFTIQQKALLLDKIYASAPELNGMLSVCELALDELNKLQMHGILWPLKYRILEIRAKITTAKDILSDVVPLSQILPSLAGYPDQSTFLVVLQNSDELRPTGGFVGTYGILETFSGDIARFETHDIYHLDMPAQGRLKIAPPEPLKLYLNKDWYMRDANWSPDWPTAARQLQWFYQQENQYLAGKDDINRFNGRFKGVIAINPRLVADLLKLVGPITIGDTTYTADNFSKLLEFEVERNYQVKNINKWDRKEVIGAIVKELKIKLLNLPSNKWESVLAILRQSFANKDLLIFLNDEQLNGIVSNNNWGGEIKQVAGDFVMLVDSNLASLKTDRVLSREISHSITGDSSGLKATTKITYHHQGTVKDWRTDHYKDYARLYVPEGSRLISFDGATVPVATTFENGKTAFGSLFYVDLNSTKTITISYYLPDHLNALWKHGKYTLYWQKQPGSRVIKAQVDATLPSLVKSMNPQTEVISSDRTRIAWPLDLTKDREISLNF